MAYLISKLLDRHAFFNHKEQEAFELKLSMHCEKAIYPPFFSF